MSEEKEVKVEYIEVQTEKYRQSDNIEEVTKGLLGFHKELNENSIKYDQKNPFYKSDYASLSNILSTIRPLLMNNGLFVMQVPMDLNGEIFIRTRISHESGQFMEWDSVGVKKSKDAQSVIGDSTYLKRASLTSILGLAFEKEDDDGNANKERNEVKTEESPRRSSRRRE